MYTQMETHVESVENLFLALNLQSCDVLVIVIIGVN